MNEKKLTLDDIADFEGNLLWLTYFNEDQLDQEAIEMIAGDADAIEMLMAHFFFDGDPEKARTYVVTSILHAGMADDAPDSVKKTFDEFQQNVLQTAIDCHLSIDPCIEDYREAHQPEEDDRPETYTELKQARKTQNTRFERHMQRRWRA